MEVPEEVKALKKSLVSRKEVEMTFKKEKFERLGEATLMNRIQVWICSLLLIGLPLRVLKALIIYLIFVIPPAEFCSVSFRLKNGY